MKKEINIINILKRSLEEKQNNEQQQNNFKIKLENIKNESELICIEKNNKDNKKYVLEKETEVKVLQKKFIESQKTCSDYLDEIDSDFESKLNIIVIKSEQEEHQQIQLPFERFYQEYILSKENFDNIIREKISVKFCIEKIKEDIESNEGTNFIKQYEEQNTLIQEYNICLESIKKFRIKQT